MSLCLSSSLSLFFSQTFTQTHRHINILKVQRHQDDHLFLSYIYTPKMQRYLPLFLFLSQTPTQTHRHIHILRVQRHQDDHRSLTHVYTPQILRDISLFLFLFLSLFRSQTHTHTHRHMNILRDTGWPRPIGCLIFTGHFPH